MSKDQKEQPKLSQGNPLKTGCLVSSEVFVHFYLSDKGLYYHLLVIMVPVLQWENIKDKKPYEIQKDNS